MRPFFVYMLRCKDGSFYVGHTDDLEARIVAHGDGTMGGYTSTRRPVELVWSAEMTTRDEALQRELQVKRWTRAKKEALIREDWARIGRLARGRDRVSMARPSTSRPQRDGDSPRAGAKLRANGAPSTTSSNGAPGTTPGADSGQAPGPDGALDA